MKSRLCQAIQAQSSQCSLSYSIALSVLSRKIQITANQFYLGQKLGTGSFGNHARLKNGGGLNS